MSASESAKAEYVNALEDEIRGRREKFDVRDTAYGVRTVYIGGGTPSCMDYRLILRLMDCLKCEFEITDTKDTEVTIEVNPGTVTDEKLRAYLEAGINRLSIGLQSADENELKTLGRIHGLDDFLRTYEAARQAGFSNINVDIMTALPGQTEESVMRTLDLVTGLKPEHISAYSLIIEEGTPFYEMYGSQDKRPADEETERRMYHMASDRLRDSGYLRYEISNFALSGYESRHNTSYWKRDDYFGFGLGASSLIANVRYKNTTSLKDYVNHSSSSELFEERIDLNRENAMEEFMFLGLRMSEGVSEDDFFSEFGVSVREEYAKELKKYTQEGLLVEHAGRICLTELGIDYGNYVFSGFLH